MSIKLVVLDMAGTTVADENAVAKAFISAFQKQGISITEEDVNPLMGYKKTLAITKVLENLGVEAQVSLVETIHRDFTEDMITYYESSSSVKPTPYAEETLQWLKEKGIRVAMNTGFPRVIADTILERFQWQERGLVDDYIASDEVDNGRPHPLMIQQLMEYAGIDNPLDVAKIGDTESDIHEGRNANCGLVIGITTGTFSRAQLAAHHPDHIIDSLQELQELIH